MTDWVAWFRYQLQASADGFVWAFSQIPPVLLDKLIDADWNAQRETLWGYKPLSMIVTKTFQHTYEHSDTLLRMGIWWEGILEEAKKSGNVGS